jgi:hypothetical protein
MPAALRVSRCRPHAQCRERQRLGRAIGCRRIRVSCRMDSAFDFLAPPAASSSLQRPETPKGRRPWMAVVFGSSHGWRVRKLLRHPHSLSDVDPLGAFFGYFLCTSKECNSPQAKALLLMARHPDTEMQGQRPWVPAYAGMTRLVGHSRLRAFAAERTSKESNSPSGESSTPEGRMVLIQMRKGRCPLVSQYSGCE